MDARYRIAHAKEAAAKIRKNPKEAEDIIAGVIAEEQARVRRQLEVPPFHLAQLRHLYAQMMAGEVLDTGRAAEGLLGPAIEAFEAHSSRAHRKAGE